MTSIEWTNETWNPVTGCNKVSPGCKNCYAEVMHRRLMKMAPQKYRKKFSEGVEMHFDDIDKPRRWKKPRYVFVNSMSDLFHEQIPDEFLDLVFRTIRECPQHTFQILTKRYSRMWTYCKRLQPIDNVIIGISAENQEQFNIRSSALGLLGLTGWRTMVSCEPLLGPITLFLDGLFENAIHWVIVGGESGHNARPMDISWARDIRDQCKNHNVPFFFKQWGAYQNGKRVWGIKKYDDYNVLDGQQYLEFPKTHKSPA